MRTPPNEQNIDLHDARRRSPHHSAISPFSPKTAPPSLVVKTALRGIFIDARKSHWAPIAPAIYRLALAPQQFTVNADRSRVRWLLIRKTSKIVDMLRPCRLALASSFRSSR
jgi:hypothetical protein